MSNQTNYQPGHSVHFIQARKALEALGQWQPAKVVEIGLGVITLQERKGTFSYLCADTSRLQGVFDTGRVPLTAAGVPFALIAPHGVLIIPCADEGKVFSTSEAVVNSAISYLEEGAALRSPTTDGAWHLFSIDLVTP